MKRIKKEGSVGSDKSQIQKISPWHRVRIATTYPIHILRYFRKAPAQIEGDVKTTDLEKGVVSSSTPTIPPLELLLN